MQAWAAQPGYAQQHQWDPYTAQPGWSWQQGAEYEAPPSAPGADEPAVPGQETEVPGPPPAPLTDAQYPAQSCDSAGAYQGWTQSQIDAWHWQQQQQSGYAQHQQQPQYQQQAAPAAHYPGHSHPSSELPQSSAQPTTLPQPSHAPHQHTMAAVPGPSYQNPHTGWPSEQQLPPPPKPATPAAPQRASGQQQKRPLAQSGADLSFRVPVKMPRGAAARSAAPASASSRSAAVPVSVPSRPSAPATGPAQFVPVAAKPAAKPAAAGSTANSWPPSLREFVTRCLKTVMSDLQASARMHAALKQIISSADQAGERWTRDWDTMPPPSLDAPASDKAQAVGASGAFAGVGAGTAAEQQHTASRRAAYQDGPSSGSKRGRAPGRPGKAERAQRRRFRSRSRSPSSSSGDSRNEHKGPALDVDEAANRARYARFGNGTVQGGRTLTAADLKQRRARIATAAVVDAGAAEDQRWDDFVIRGTCQALEKSYFRLTAAPDPSDVRPEPVLRAALERLVGQLAAPQPVKYLYALDQFKGMRQDLTVQHLGGQIAADIYEAAARAALENGDLPEYHQCQARLDVLYAAGVQGCRQEFLAYRILYQVAHSAQAGGAAALLSTLRLVNAQAAAHPAVAHAMRVRKMAGLADATGLCALYASAPALGRALLDLLLPRARFSALKALAGAIAPALPVAHLASLLGFCGSAAGQQGAAQGALPGCMRRSFPGRYAPADSAAAGKELCRQWLLSHGAVLTPSPSSPGELQMDCKASKGQLAVPEDTAAVAHGDAFLNVNDFLKGVLG